MATSVNKYIDESQYNIEAARLSFNYLLADESIRDTEYGRARLKHLRAIIRCIEPDCNGLSSEGTRKCWGHNLDD